MLRRAHDANRVEVNLTFNRGMDVAPLVTLAIGVLGVAGLIFTALRFNRDDTTAIVTQQSMLVGEMTAINNELRATATTLRDDRDRCYEEVSKLRELTQRIDRRLDTGNTGNG